MKKKALKITSLETTPAPVPASMTAVPPPVLPSPVANGDAMRRIAANWKVVAIIAAAATLLALLITAVQPKRYRASAIAAVTPNVSALAPADVMRGVDTLERRTLVATVAALAATPLTHRTAAGGDAAYAIDAVVLPNTNLVRVNVEGADANRVAAIANKVPEVIGTQTSAMYKFYRVTMVSAATAPRQAEFPRTGRTAAAGLLLGLALGAFVAYVIAKP